MFDLINGLWSVIFTYLKSFLSIYNQLAGMNDEVITAIFKAFCFNAIGFLVVVLLFKRVK